MAVRERGGVELEPVLISVYLKEREVHDLIQGGMATAAVLASLM